MNPHTELTLLQHYIAYRVDNWMLTPRGRVFTLRTEGVIICSRLMGFEEWKEQNDI